MALRSTGSLSLKSAVVVGLLCLLVPIASWAHSTNSNIPGTCFPGAVCVFNQGGTAVGGVSGLIMNGTGGSKASGLLGIGTQSIKGTLSFTTGAIPSFGSGTCALPPCTLGMFGDGTLKITVSKLTPWNGFSGTLFTGTFGGPNGIAWIYNGLITNKQGQTFYQYELVGPISGIWGPTKTQVDGQTAQIFFDSTTPYTGGPIKLASGTTSVLLVTPEPANVGLLGTGLILIGFLVRRRAKQQQSDDRRS